MAGLDDITGKAKQFLNDSKVQDALKSEKAEDVSDKVLDGVAEVADKVTGGKFSEQITSARDKADGAIGTE